MTGRGSRAFRSPPAKDSAAQAKRGSFPHKGSNWIPRDVVSAAAWDADVALLDNMHRSLRATVAQQSPADLPVTPPGSKVSNWEILAGIAAHDVYHAGQIQVVKKLVK